MRSSKYWCKNSKGEISSDESNPKIEKIDPSISLSHGITTKKSESDNSNNKIVELLDNIGKD